MIIIRSQDKYKVNEIAVKNRKVPVIVTVPSFCQDDEIHTLIKTLGLKWDVMNQHWHGKGDLVELRALLEPYGGEVREG